MSGREEGGLILGMEQRTKGQKRRGEKEGVGRVEEDKER